MSSTTTPLDVMPPASNTGAIVPGLYIVQLDSIEDAGTSKFPNKDGSPRYQVMFAWTIKRVLDSEAPEPDALVGTRITRYPTKSMGRKANMRKWLEAHLNRELEDREQLAAADVIGSFAKMHVAIVDGEFGEETHITMQPYVRPAKATKPAPKVVEPAADDDKDPWDE